MGRIAMDLAGALLILYTTYWLLRPDDFVLVMTLFLLAVVAALPFWLWLARTRQGADLRDRLAVVGRDQPRSLVRDARMAALADLRVGAGRGPRLRGRRPDAVVDARRGDRRGRPRDRRAPRGSLQRRLHVLRKLGGALGVFL